MSFDEWVKKTAALPADKQVEAVAAKLKERNPGFDGTVKPTIENGVVTGLEFLTVNVADVSPVRALAGLRTLNCQGTWPKVGRQLADLSPLKDMKLTSLDCTNTEVSDLTPLKDMKLTFLSCAGTHVIDLSPLKGMQLEWLWFHYTGVPDLSPLKDMKLTNLDCERHAGVRPVAAEGHEADGLELRRHAGVRPVAAEGHEADGFELRRHESG